MADVADGGRESLTSRPCLYRTVSNLARRQRNFVLRKKGKEMEDEIDMVIALNNYDASKRKDDTGECLHSQYVDVFPKEAFIHLYTMPEGKTYKNDTIRLRICFDCGKIIEVVDYGE